MSKKKKKRKKKNAMLTKKIYMKDKNIILSVID